MPTQPHDASILIVDDNEDILHAARLLLKRHFASVQTLEDPSKLGALMRKSSFDVLLLDMNFTAGADDGAEGLARLAEVLAIGNPELDKKALHAKAMAVFAAIMA